MKHHTKAKFWPQTLNMSYTNHPSQPKACKSSRQKKGNISETKSQLSQCQKLFCQLMGQGALLSQKGLTGGIELGMNWEWGR